MLACDAIVTDAWLTPHFPARADRPYEVVMLQVWKEVMLYEDYYEGMWSSRIAFYLTNIPRALNERGGRVATTFALWLMTNVGGVFLNNLFKQRGIITDFSFDTNSVVRALWANENKVVSYKRNTLEMLLRDERNQPVYEVHPYPTLEDNRVVEYFSFYFTTDEGKNLLRTVYKKTGRRLHSKFEHRALPFT